MPPSSARTQRLGARGRAPDLTAAAPQEQGTGSSTAGEHRHRAAPAPSLGYSPSTERDGSAPRGCAGSRQHPAPRGRGPGSTPLPTPRCSLLCLFMHLPFMQGRLLRNQRLWMLKALIRRDKTALKIPRRQPPWGSGAGRGQAAQAEGLLPRTSPAPCPPSGFEPPAAARAPQRAPVRAGSGDWLRRARGLLPLEPPAARAAFPCSRQSGDASGSPGSRPQGAAAAPHGARRAPPAPRGVCAPWGRSASSAPPASRPSCAPRWPPRQVGAPCPLLPAATPSPRQGPWLQLHMAPAIGSTERPARLAAPVRCWPQAPARDSWVRGAPHGAGRAGEPSAEPGGCTQRGGAEPHPAPAPHPSCLQPCRGDALAAAPLESRGERAWLPSPKETCPGQGCHRGLSAPGSCCCCPWAPARRLRAAPGSPAAALPALRLSTVRGAGVEGERGARQGEQHTMRGCRTARPGAVAVSVAQ